MKAKSISGKTVEEIKSALQETIEDGYQPTLAFVFISVSQGRKALCAVFRQHGIDILGMTSCGEFTNGTQTEGGISVLMMDLPRDKYSLSFEEIGEGGIKEAAAKLATDALQKFDNPALILCSTAINLEREFLDGEVLVQSLKARLGSHRLFFGGMAGDDGTFTGTCGIL